MNERWIKIYARITEWEWYTDPVVFKLFMHLLLRANYKPARSRGKLYPRGVVLSSQQSLADETGLSVKNVRTALERLMSTGEIKVHGTSVGSMITICNYDKYQCEFSENGEPAANDRRTTDEPAASCIDIKNNRNTEYRVVDDMTREEFLEAFFSESRSSILSEICRSRKLGSVGDFRRLAGLVVAEWEATGAVHTSVADANRHLISHCDVKNKAEKAALSNPGPARKLFNHEQKTTAQNTLGADDARQEQFRDNIARLLATDYTEPDIAGCY